MSLLRATGRPEVHAALHQRVISLYRNICRKVPRMLQMYELGQAPREIRHVVALMFRKNAHITDPRIIEMLLLKGDMEVEEVMNLWKQKGHIISMFNLNKRRVGEKSENKEKIEDQWWLSAMLETLEQQTDETLDADVANRIIEYARSQKRGEVPGQELAPATGEITERYMRFQQDGKTDYLDRFLVGTEHDNPASSSSRPSHNVIPKELKDLRQRRKEGKVTREQLRQGLLVRAAQDEQGFGPSVRPPKSVENKNLPLWMATKVHYPWIDEDLSCDDPRLLAATEEAQDTLEEEYNRHKDDPSLLDKMVSRQREQLSDKYRYGRAA